MHIITIKAKRAQSLKEYIVGLIGEKNPKALVLRTRFGIHTFGLRFPIDIAVLDKHNAVVKLRTKLSKNSIFVWNPKYATVLEMPIGTIEKNGIVIGSKIEILF